MPTTHLPYADFTKTAMTLSNYDLVKQWADGYLILDTLIAKRDRWKNHNAVVMWRGAEVMLWKYVTAICLEMQDRELGGYNEITEVSELVVDALTMGKLDATNKNYQPWWLGVDGLHRSHRSMLLQKDPAWYGRKFNDVKPGLGYVWPESRPPILVTVQETRV
jgi:hypothetical protein